LTVENTTDTQNVFKKKDDPTAPKKAEDTTTTDTKTTTQADATQTSASQAFLDQSWNDIFKLKTNVSDNQLTAIKDTAAVGDGQKNWFDDPSLAEFWGPTSGGTTAVKADATTPKAPDPAEKAGFWDFLGDYNPAKLFSSSDKPAATPEKPVAPGQTAPPAEEGFFAKAWDKAFDWAFKSNDAAGTPTDKEVHVGMDQTGKVGEAGIKDANGKTVTDGKQVTHTDVKGNTVTDNVETGLKSAKSGDGKNEYTETVNAQGQKEQTWKDDDGREIHKVGEKYEIKSPEGQWTEITPDGKMSRMLQHIGDHEMKVTQMTKPLPAEQIVPQTNELVAGKTTDGKGIAKYKDNDGNVVEVSSKGTAITTKNGAVFVINGDNVMVRGADGQFHAVSEQDLPAGITHLEGGGVQVGGMKIQSEAHGGVTTDGKRIHCHREGDNGGITISDAHDPSKKVVVNVNTATGANSVDWPDKGGRTTVDSSGVAKILDSHGQEVATYDHGHVSNNAIDFASNCAVTMKWSGDKINADGSVTLSDGSSLTGGATYESAAGASQSAISSSQSAISAVSGKFGGGSVITDADLGALQSALGSLGQAMNACIQSGNLDALGSIVAAQGNVSSVLGAAEPLVKIYSDLKSQGLNNGEIGDAQKNFHNKTIQQVEEEATSSHRGPKVVPEQEDRLRTAS
jgi:hypothetical protein